MRMRFLIDENLSPDLVDAIHHLEPQIDVKYVRGPDAPAEGTPDPAILEFCEREQRALITNNRKTMSGHERDHFALSGHHFGIFWLREGFSWGSYAADEFLLWAASEAEEWVDQSRWLPL